MASFFIRRPIVAIVIAILTVIIGSVAILGLPIAQFPNIAPPEVQVKATYTGADALTVEQSVATPIEQQMSGVDNMNYMYSLNTNAGQMTLTVDFGLETDPNTDQILAQMRQGQAASQLPASVNNFGVTVQKSTSSPLLLFTLFSPNNTYDSTFLANYAYININDQLTRVKGIASVTIFGAGQYAMRIWVNPDQLAKLGITIPEIISAIQAQNNVNPAGQIGSEPLPKDMKQAFTYTVRSQGRLTSEEEFGKIVIRAKSDGAMVKISDVARVELGAQVYNVTGRMNGKPSAIIAVYQLPGSNALDAANGAKALMKKLKQSFPTDLDYAVSLDTTLAVTEGIEDILHTLVEAMILVIIVVFIFLQGWRPTLIPLLAVPVSLIGTFAFFPLFGFSINTICLLAMVLAIGLVVDDAIVVVEAVEHHIEKGLSPVAATQKAMEEVSGPVIAIALILASVFIPTAFIPGITGKMYQQFAVTIAISVLLSAFNALTLSPALASMILRPRKEVKGPLGAFYRGFNFGFGKTTNGYVGTCHFLIRKAFFSMAFLLLIAVGAGYYGSKLPSAFLPDEDMGYFYVNLQLPNASSLQRTNEVCKKVEDMIMKTPGVQYTTTVVGFSLLSGVQNTYSGFFFVTLKPWGERKTIETNIRYIMGSLNRELAQIPEAIAFSFPPPAIPGVGSSGGVTFILEDRSGSDIAFLDKNVKAFLAAASKRKELGRVTTTFLPQVPQVYVHVDQDKALKQQVQLSDVYQTMQTFMGGAFVNYFNRFGRQWQVYVQAEGAYRGDPSNLGQFYVRNKDQNMVPLSAITRIDSLTGPEFTMRYNLFRSAQINVTPAPGVSTGQATKALEEVFAETMPTDMGFDYMGMSFQEQQAAQGVSPMAIFALSLLFVFLLLAAQYESWALPFSVLMSVPVAVFGAFFSLHMLGMDNNIYAQIGLVMLIGLAAKNAILIVEFAKLELEKGRNFMDAALEGARLRLRPILMTAFAFILGCVPLLIASGAGAVSRRVIGTTVVGGMLAATLLAVFLIPVCFYVVEKISHGKGHDEPKGLEPEPDAAIPVAPLAVSTLVVESPVVAVPVARVVPVAVVPAASPSPVVVIPSVVKVAPVVAPAPVVAITPVTPVAPVVGTPPAPVVSPAAPATPVATTPPVAVPKPDSKPAFAPTPVSMGSPTFKKLTSRIRPEDLKD